MPEERPGGGGLVLLEGTRGGAMAAFFLKGVAPKHVTLNQIFAGMMPYMLIVILCLIFMYIWPEMMLWLPEFLYGG